MDHSRDEFKKSKPPTFDGEIKIGQEAEAWILGIKKYFQVQDYSGNMKARVSIFNLNGRASIWWVLPPFHTPGSRGRNLQATRCVLGGKSRVKAVTLFLTPPFRLNS